MIATVLTPPAGASFLGLARVLRVLALDDGDEDDSSPEPLVVR